MSEFSTNEFLIKPIAVMESPYRTKFAIPRQSSLIHYGQFFIKMLPPFNNIDAFAGIEEFSHLWISFIFHEVDKDKAFAPKIRPPRLGGDAKIGVFASRSPFRPNRIGLSSVKLKRVIHKNKEVRLEVEGADLVNNTPIIDIKPYVKYTDAHIDANCSFAKFEPLLTTVEFTELARTQIAKTGIPNFLEFIAENLSQDPRPAYKKRREQDEVLHEVDSKEYGVQFYDYDVHWISLIDKILVTRIEAIA